MGASHLDDPGFDHRGYLMGTAVGIGGLVDQAGDPRARVAAEPVVHRLAGHPVAFRHVGDVCSTCNGSLLTRGNMVEMMGLEPTTPCLQSRCSSQLSYIPWCPRRTVVSSVVLLPLARFDILLRPVQPSHREPIRQCRVVWAGTAPAAPPPGPSVSQVGSTVTVNGPA